MQQILILMSLIFFSMPSFAKAPFKTINFAFQNNNTLGFQINYHEGHGINAQSIFRLTETENFVYSNFIFHEDGPFCAKEKKKLSCALPIKALLPKCAFTDARCDQSSSTEIHNVKLNFTLDVIDESYNFSGSIVSDDGNEFTFDNKDFRSIVN